jgi:hypothetical protein
MKHTLMLSNCRYTIDNKFSLIDQFWWIGNFYCKSVFMTEVLIVWFSNFFLIFIISRNSFFFHIPPNDLICSTVSCKLNSQLIRIGYYDDDDGLCIQCAVRRTVPLLIINVLLVSYIHYERTYLEQVNMKKIKWFCCFWYTVNSSSFCPTIMIMMTATIVVCATTHTSHDCWPGRALAYG